jgi:DNA-binding beta-propeller fold protein YncE
VGSSFSKLIVLAKNGSKLWDADLQQIVFLDHIVPISVLDDGTCWITTLRGFDVVGIKEGKVICHIKLEDLLGYFPSYGIKDVKISRDGRYMLMALFDDHVRFYSISNNKFSELWRWQPIGSAEQVALSDDNNYVLIRNADNVVTLLRSNGSLVWERRLLPGYPIFYLAFIPCSNLICLILFESVKTIEVGVLDLESKWVVKPFPLDVVFSFRHGFLSKDFLFIPEDLLRSNKVYVYDWRDQEIISEIVVKGDIRDLAATPDGKYLVVCDDLFRIYLFKRSFCYE